ncbi:MAG: cell division protein FtsZ, partial [Sciscionella sp.]
NLDFADVKSVMSGAGSALMGIGSSRGEGRAVQAAEKAINSPLLEASMDGAHGVLLAVAGGSDIGLFEIHEAASLVQESAHPEANIIFGTVIDDSLGDEVRVTVIAAGFDSGAPTHKRLDPTAVGSRNAVASAQAGYVNPGSSQQTEQTHQMPSTPAAGRQTQQGHQGQDRQGAANGYQQSGPGADGRPPQQGGAGALPAPGYRPAGPWPPSAMDTHRGPGAHQGQEHGFTRAVPNQPEGSGGLQGRVVPVAEDSDDDEVDVPPFMRR